jgi:CheY-like chemotaxis protein
MGLKTNSLRSISILFVEDDEVILELQSSILAVKFPDIMLYTSINGRQGLELFKAHTPDIFLTDINMSERCGVHMSENNPLSVKSNHNITSQIPYVPPRPIRQAFAPVLQ